MDHLETLLTRSRALGAEYRRGLANHLPMALIALRRLGASDDTLEQMLERHLGRLEPLEAIGPKDPIIDRDNWTDFFGRHAHNAAYVRYFSDQIAHLGVETTLRAHLRALVPGIGGGAFHPLIRLGYALDQDDRDEVAHALAAWAMAHFPLGPIPELATTTDPVRVLVDTNAAHGNDAVRGATIFERMKVVADRPGFAALAGALDIQPGMLGVISKAILEVYANSGDNFTALHGVTAAHALRWVLPYAPEVETLRFFWQAFLAAVITVGAPLPLASTGSRDGVEASWADISRAAIGSPDDHVIKLVYSAREQARFYDDELYRRVAAQKVGLDRPAKRAVGQWG